MTLLYFAPGVGAGQHERPDAKAGSAGSNCEKGASEPDRNVVTVRTEHRYFAEPSCVEADHHALCAGCDGSHTIHGWMPCE